MCINSRFCLGNITQSKKLLKSVELSYIVYTPKQTVIHSKSYSQNFLRERVCYLSVRGEKRVIAPKALHSQHIQNYCCDSWEVTTEVHQYIWEQLPERLISRKEGNYSLQVRVSIQVVNSPTMAKRFSTTAHLHT